MAVLRPLSSQLPQRLLDLIECESAFNDPMAVVLAGVALAMVTGTDADGITVMSVVLRQFLLGGLIGFMGGTFGAQLLEQRSLKELKSGQAVICLAVLLVLLGGTTLLGGSGLLAAYIGGLVIGNHDQVDRQELEDGHEVFMKLAELLLFLCMGLVVDPEAVLRMLPWIALLFVAMQIVRLLTVPPLLAASCSRAEKLFVSFCGLRGAVPIALAIQAAAQAKGPGAWGHAMPPLALGVVLLGLLVQGFSLVPLAQRLGLASADAA
jgi:CPA1 family monovalent cation:H+ antiporter/cell volume regulation protein A